MMFTITICCFFANIICGIATVRYGLKSNGMPGVLCVLLTLTVSVVWTFAEIFFLPSENNWLGQIKFFAWTLLPFLPWIFLWRKKYKILSPELFRIGLSGFLTQAVFFYRNNLSCSWRKLAGITWVWYPAVLRCYLITLCCSGTLTEFFSILD